MKILSVDIDGDHDIKVTEHKAFKNAENQVKLKYYDLIIDNLEVLKEELKNKFNEEF